MQTGLRDFVKIIGRAAVLRHRAGFFDAPPPYSTNDLIERCRVFQGVRVLGAELPPNVIEIAESQPGRRVLFYNNAMPTAVQRVGIVHGLGHFLTDLKGTHGLSECNPGLRELEAVGRLSTDPVEVHCDLFAYEILVPFDVLDRYAPRNLSPSNEVERLAFSDETDRLASKFHVPVPVMRVRLADLALLRRTSFWVG